MLRAETYANVHRRVSIIFCSVCTILRPRAVRLARCFSNDSARVCLFRKFAHARLRWRAAGRERYGRVFVTELGWFLRDIPAVQYFVCLHNCG